MDYGNGSGAAHAGGAGGLAATGAGITIGGVFVSQLWLVIIAVSLVVIGAAMIRLGFRPNKGVGER